MLVTPLYVSNACLPQSKTLVTSNYVGHFRNRAISLRRYQCTCYWQNDCTFILKDILIQEFLTNIFITRSVCVSFLVPLCYLFSLAPSPMGMLTIFTSKLSSWWLRTPIHMSLMSLYSCCFLTNFGQRIKSYHFVVFSTTHDLHARTQHLWLAGLKNTKILLV